MISVNFHRVSLFCFWRYYCFLGFSFLSRQCAYYIWDLWRLLGVCVWERESWPIQKLPTYPLLCFPRRACISHSHRALWQHHLQEPPASWLQHIHLLRPKPGPLQVQDAPTLFRTGVPPPLRARFKDYPFCVCLHSCLQSSRQSRDPACRILASSELAALLWWFSLHVFRDSWCGDFSYKVWLSGQIHTIRESEVSSLCVVPLCWAPVSLVFSGSPVWSRV